MGIFSKDIVISIADNMFIFNSEDREQPLVIPAYCAIQTGTGICLAFGDEALSMRNKEPENISVVNVLQEGSAADVIAFRSLVRYGLKLMSPNLSIFKPRVMVAARAHNPYLVSIRTMLKDVGLKEIYFLDHAMASAMGMGLEIQQPELKMVLSINYDWFEFAIISSADIICKTSFSIGSDSFVDDIRFYIRNSRNFLPEKEEIKQKLFRLGVMPEALSKIRGWEAWLGQSKLGRMRTQEISAETLSIGILPSLIRMSERIKETINLLPKERYYELKNSRIHFCGLGSRIPGIAEILSKQLGLKIEIYKSDIHPSIFGVTQIPEQFKRLKKELLRGQRSF